VIFSSPVPFIKFSVYSDILIYRSVNSPARPCITIIYFFLQRCSPPSLVLSLSPGLGPDGLPSPGGYAAAAAVAGNPNRSSPYNAPYNEHLMFQQLASMRSAAAVASAADLPGLISPRLRASMADAAAAAVGDEQDIKPVLIKPDMIKVRFN
jgi:hypothetical protein